MYSESPQESLDTVIQAFRISEKLSLPLMISHDAFYVSHAVEPVDLPQQDQVDSFLPEFSPELRLDTSLGQSFGAPIDQATWNRSRRETATAMQQVEDEVSETGKVWGDLTGRPYAALEYYRTEGARVVIVTMGSMCGTTRDAVDALRDQGTAVGLLKVRQFRPLPVQTLRKSLAGVPCVLVLDRNYSPGMGGILHQELKSALFAMGDAPRVHGFLTGVGGVNVPSTRIQQLVVEYADEEPSVDSVWVD